MTLLNKHDSETLIAQASASVGNTWKRLPYTSPILTINAALLYTGKIFFFCGSGNNPEKLNSPYNSYVLDLSSGTFTSLAPPKDPSGIPYDLFCAGQTFRSEGILMIAGGTLQYDPFEGLTATFFFDPILQQLTQQASMNSGRWYPTLLTLGGGRIFAISGIDQNQALNIQPEIFSLSFGPGWRAFPATKNSYPQYAHIYLMSTGQIFYAGCGMGGNNGAPPTILTLPSLDPASTKQAIGETLVPGLADPDYSNQSASVLLPPAQAQKVLICGGGSGGKATQRVNIVDLTASNPNYSPAASLNYARMHHSAVLLPDRTVFVCNGSQMEETPSTGQLPAEIYNPTTNTWTVAATPNASDRVYHSVALLLPDGSVLTSGGNPDRANNCANSNPPQPVSNCQDQTIEIYSPSYMSKTRPIIQSAPTSVAHGQKITIQTAQAQNIKWVHLIKPMATTHGCDTEQRLVDLPITSSTNSSLTVSVTSEVNLLPDGWYMLFITDNNNVPSVATWIQIPT